MTDKNNFSLDNSKSSKAIDDSNNKSIKEDFFKINQNFVETSIHNSFKSLNSNLYNVLNSSFSNFNNDYEKKLETNREIHEKAILALNSDISNLKESLLLKKNILTKNEKDICDKHYNRMMRYKIISKIFTILLKKYQEKKTIKKKEKFALRICMLKKKRNIITCWRNITNARGKSRIKLKFSKMYNEHRKEIESYHMTEINNFLEILQKLELDIAKEIDERKALNKLYDMKMNEGAEKFIKETSAINELNSSSNIFFITYLDVFTPNERSFRQKEKENIDNK